MYREKNKNKRKIGAEQEALAEQYLIKQGYHILQKNFYSRFGEIDIIAKKDKYLVFIEVKYRKDEKMGFPEEAIDMRKQNNIIQMARFYMFQKKISENTPCRFDVVCILGEKIRLLENAFSPSQ